jgi:hypothetical protein
LEIFYLVQQTFLSLITGSFAMPAAENPTAVMIGPTGGKSCDKT